MPKQFYTADAHFLHAAILRLCSRPYASIEEHDRALIDNWNAVVGPDDVVWVVGDFSYRGDPKHVRRIFDQLHGREKHLIYGNHDTRGPNSRTATVKLPWTSQAHYAETVDDGSRIIMGHYGMRVWPGMHKGSIHLFGHSHGRLPGTRQCIDVGVDVMGYAPVDIETIKARLAQLPELDIVPGADAVESLAVDPAGAFDDGTDQGWQP